MEHGEVIPGHSVRSPRARHERDSKKESAERPCPAARSIDFTFFWQAPRPNPWRPDAYRKATPAQPASKPAPKAREPLWPMERLRESDRADVEQLIRLGADELRHGLSLSALKKAYRRLARKWHPDMHAAAPPAQSERARHAFTLVQTAYERLRHSLPKYKSDDALAA
ncbi:MAG: DnaJ domain-containing protein [Calothrix sp. SM1_5_4]|nr:DnaJ domain-containing protein [Calothrix sp. SM1_5_4]